MARATLDGVLLTADQPAGWSITTGTEPFAAIFHVHEAEASRIEAKIGQPVTFEIAGEVKVEKLYVVQRVGSPAPHIASFKVVDRRWLWNNHWISRRYNVPRRTGGRTVFEGAAVIELVQLGDEWTYADWSLDQGKKWKPRELIESLLRRLVGFEFRIDGGLGRDVPIENLELDDPGPAALARALAHCPGADLYVDADGTVVVFDTQDVRAVGDVVRQLGKPVVGGGLVRPVSLRAVRPKEIHVLFDREVELRFDAQEEGEDVSETVAANDSTLEMFNVLPSPDLRLDVAESQPGIASRSVLRGTWLRIVTALAAWQQDRLDGVPATYEVNVENVRRFWLNGLWSVWTDLGKKDPDANWAARLSFLRAHFRQTYQLAPNWMRRILTIHPWRVAIVDPRTGARAPALVEMDYSQQPSEKAVFNAFRKRTGFFSWLNVRGYPSDGLIASGYPSPVQVQVLDDQLGVIHFSLLPEPLGNVSAMHPSVIETLDGKTGTPHADLRDFAIRDVAPLVGTHVEGYQSGALQLSPDHRILCVLTATPAAPNNERRLHKIVIKQDDVGDILPDPARGADGPVMQIRVPSSVYAARFMWFDSVSPALYPRVFGFGQEDPDLAGVESEELEKGEIWQNVKECRDLAKAAALSIWSKLADHYEGSQVGHVAGDVKPVGNLGAVTHQRQPNGALLTSIALPPEVKPIDLFAFLDHRTRHIVMGLVNFK